MDWQPTSLGPSDEAIEALIQQATSATPYPRSGPLRDTRTQLFVGNLPYRVRWQDLKDLFRKAGTVLRADVSLGPDNRSRGYGTVLLATAEDAGRAVDMFNGYSWQTRILEVRLDRQLQEFDSPIPSVGTNSSSYLSLLSSVSKSSSVTDDLDYPPSFRSKSSDPNSCRNLFVGNLPFHCQWQDLKDLFRQAGTIIRADVVLGPDGRSRGFGTVVFATDLDAERALKMFNGYEFNGRVLNVHNDKYSYSSSQLVATPTSPVGGSSSDVSSHSHPTHITLPPGYMLDLVPPSGPTSPYEMSKYLQHQHLRDQQQQQLQRQTQMQQLYLQLQQQQQRPSHQQQYQHRQQQQHQSPHQGHQQQRSRLNTPSLLDVENLSDTPASTSTLKRATSMNTTSTYFADYPNFPLPSSSSCPNPPSTPATTLTTKHPIPIPAYKAPPLSHASTATSSGSDGSSSEMFSALGSTSATSVASWVSKNSSALSRPHSQGQGQGYPYGKVPGQGQGQGHRARGQPSFQTSSPHSLSSPEPSRSASVFVPASASPHSHTHSHSGSHRRLSPPYCSSPHAPQSSSYTTTNANTRPSPFNPNPKPNSQRPGPISLPPPLLPSQVAFSIPLQQLSPHVHTPLGMSVSVSVSPLVEHPGGFGYGSGMYGQAQQQQFGQHMIPLQVTTPHGLLPMTPSMPSFTFLPSAMPSALQMTPSERSTRGTGAGSGSGGRRRTRSRSKSLARRRLEMKDESGTAGGEDENVWNNSSNPNISLSNGPTAVCGSSARQRHSHHQQHHQSQQHQCNAHTPTHGHMQSTQGQQSYYSSQPSKHSADPATGAGGQGAQFPPNAPTQSQPQLIPMHINLTAIPGAFSPGVVMSPGTFYGRPGEAPTFSNAAVGAPLTSRGSDGDASEVGDGSAGVVAPIQGQEIGQWYHQNQSHGAYFYTMSSPRRKTPTGMEPKGYFDPLYFPAGVNVGGGYTSSVNGGALVNEIMKDGHAQALGVEGDVGSGVGGTGRGGEEEERYISDISDDRDDEGDDDEGHGGDDDAAGDADDDDSGEDEDEVEEKEGNRGAHDIHPPSSQGKVSDRRPTQGAGISRTLSLPVPKEPHHQSHQAQDTVSSEDRRGDRRRPTTATQDASFGSGRDSSIARTQSLPVSKDPHHHHHHHHHQHSWMNTGRVADIVEVHLDSEGVVENASSAQTHKTARSIPIIPEAEQPREQDENEGEGSAGNTNIGLEQLDAIILPRTLSPSNEDGENLLV